MKSGDANRTARAEEEETGEHAHVQHGREPREGQALAHLRGGEVRRAGVVVRGVPGVVARSLDTTAQCVERPAGAMRPLSSVKMSRWRGQKPRGHSDGGMRLMYAPRRRCS